MFYLDDVKERINQEVVIYSGSTYGCAYYIALGSDYYPEAYIEYVEGMDMEKLYSLQVPGGIIFDTLAFWDDENPNRKIVGWLYDDLNYDIEDILKDIQGALLELRESLKECYPYPIRFMEIVEINEEEIVFNNGNRITFYHEGDCCEWNYADFKELEDTTATDISYPVDLEFEKGEYGFRFGSELTGWTFVPCYSEQSGYYSYDVDIFYNGARVLTTECQDTSEC